MRLGCYYAGLPRVFRGLLRFQAVVDGGDIGHNNILPLTGGGVVPACPKFIDTRLDLASECPHCIERNVELPGQHFQGILLLPGNGKVRYIKCFLDRELQAVENGERCNGFVITTTRTASRKLLSAFEVFFVSTFPTMISSTLPFLVFDEAIA